MTSLIKFKEKKNLSFSHLREGFFSLKCSISSELRSTRGFSDSGKTETPPRGFSENQIRSRARKPGQ